MPKPFKATTGDDFLTIAKAHGYTDYNAVYKSPLNGKLAKQRPANQLCVDDVVLIPDKGQKDEARSAGQQHAFKVGGVKIWIRLAVLTFSEQPAKNQPYRLLFNHTVQTGTTTAEGLIEKQIELTPLGDSEETARLELPKLGQAFTLQLGQLYPMKTPEGMQARLNNLNFPCGKVDGDLGKRSHAAIAEFQSCQGMTHPDGNLDDKQATVLTDHHDKKRGEGS